MNEITANYFHRIGRGIFSWEKIEDRKEILENRLCPEDCPFLILTEGEQDYYYEKRKIRKPHYCKRYQKQVKHLDAHPELRMLNECKVWED